MVQLHLSDIQVVLVGSVILFHAAGSLGQRCGMHGKLAPVYVGRTAVVKWLGAVLASLHMTALQFKCCQGPQKQAKCAVLHAGQ